MKKMNTKFTQLSVLGGMIALGAVSQIASGQRVAAPAVENPTPHRQSSDLDLSGAMRCARAVSGLTFGSVELDRRANPPILTFPTSPNRPGPSGRSGFYTVTDRMIYFHPAPIDETFGLHAPPPQYLNLEVPGHRTVALSSRVLPRLQPNEIQPSDTEAGEMYRARHPGDQSPDPLRLSFGPNRDHGARQWVGLDARSFNEYRYETTLLNPNDPWDANRPGHARQNIAGSEVLTGDSRGALQIALRKMIQGIGYNAQRTLQRVSGYIEQDFYRAHGSSQESAVVHTRRTIQRSIEGLKSCARHVRDPEIQSAIAAERRQLEELVLDTRYTLHGLIPDRYNPAVATPATAPSGSSGSGSTVGGS